MIQSKSYEIFQSVSIKQRGIIMGSFTPRLLIGVLVVVLSAAFFAGCAGTHLSNGKVPDEGRLRERISEFHNALGNNDIAAWYAMISPIIRDKMTFGQFKKGFRWDENSASRSKSTMQAELSRVCRCSEMRLLRCVLVADVSVTRPGQEPSKERPIETWEFANGEWYWAYMGPDTGGRCPASDTFARITSHWVFLFPL